MPTRIPVDRDAPEASPVVASEPSPAEMVIRSLESGSELRSLDPSKDDRMALIDLIEHNGDRDTHSASAT